jgi:hypothetical protein
MANKTPQPVPVVAAKQKQTVKSTDRTAATPARAVEGAAYASLNLDNLQPADILTLQRTIGNSVTTRLIQTKLTVGPAGDQYEQEADRVAAQVMTMPVPVQAQSPVQRVEEEEELQMKPLAASITPLVQRAPEEEEELQMKPLAERVQRVEEEEELQAKPDVQRVASGAGFEVGGEFEQQLSASRGGGSPLPAEVRSFMEPRFGADFSGVRLHTGRDAAQLNREVSAQAFTHGQDIYLGEGKSDVASPTGKALLAHELTHTIQQGAVVRKTDDEGVQRSAEWLMRMPDIQRLTEEEWKEIEAAGLKRTVHSDERAIQRNIWASSIINTYRRGTQYSDPDHPNATVYYSDVKHLMLAVSNDDQSLITAYRTFKPKAKWVAI